MSRTATMAVGFFLILMGLQLHVIESFTMTPRVSHFLNDNFSQHQPGNGFVPNAPALDNFANAPTNYSSPYYQASFNRQPNGGGVLARQVSAVNRGGSSQITPPRWICWPVFFLGAFFLLSGASKSRG